MKANVIKLTYTVVFKKDEIVVVTLMFFKDSTSFYALKHSIYLSSHVNPIRILINSELVFIKGNSKVWKAAGQE